MPRASRHPSFFFGRRNKCGVTKRGIKCSKSQSTFLAIALCCFATTAFARQMDDMEIAVLRTIDKLSARTRTFEVPVDKTVKFGSSLFIKVRACQKASPIDLPESAAFLQIWERKPEEEKSRWVFSGWMLASSPGVSAMDHPVYDVWVIDCKNKAEKAQEFSSEMTPAPAVGQSPPPSPAPVPNPEEEGAAPSAGD